MERDKFVSHLDTVLSIAERCALACLDSADIDNIRVYCHNSARCAVQNILPDDAQVSYLPRVAVRDSSATAVTAECETAACNHDSYPSNTDAECQNECENENTIPPVAPVICLDGVDAPLTDWAWEAMRASTERSLLRGIPNHQQLYFMSSLLSPRDELHVRCNVRHLTGICSPYIALILTQDLITGGISTSLAMNAACMMSKRLSLPVMGFVLLHPSTLAALQRLERSIGEAAATTDSFYFDDNAFTYSDESEGVKLLYAGMCAAFHNFGLRICGVAVDPDIDISEALDGVFVALNGAIHPSLFVIDSDWSLSDIMLQLRLASMFAGRAEVLCVCRRMLVSPGHLVRRIASINPDDILAHFIDSYMVQAAYSYCDADATCFALSDDLISSTFASRLSASICMFNCLLSADVTSRHLVPQRDNDHLTVSDCIASATIFLSLCGSTADLTHELRRFHDIISHHRVGSAFLWGFPAAGPPEDDGAPKWHALSTGQTTVPSFNIALQRTRKAIYETCMASLVDELTVVDHLVRWTADVTVAAATFAALLNPLMGGDGASSLQRLFIRGLLLGTTTSSMHRVHSMLAPYGEES